MCVRISFDKRACNKLDEELTYNCLRNVAVTETKNRCGRVTNDPEEGAAI